MARERNYNWTPRQMARVNARREARGQEAYVNTKFDDPEYAKKYIEESDIYASKKQKNKPALIADNDEEENLSLSERMAKRTQEFKNKFGVKGGMGIKSSVRKEASKLKGKPLEIERSFNGMLS